MNNSASSALSQDRWEIMKEFCAIPFRYVYLNKLEMSLLGRFFENNRILNLNSKGLRQLELTKLSSK